MYYRLLASAAREHPGPLSPTVIHLSFVLGTYTYTQTHMKTVVLVDRPCPSIFYAQLPEELAAYVLYARGRYVPLRTLYGSRDSINCLQINADGKWLAAGGDDGRLTIFDHQSCGCHQTWRTHQLSSMASLASIQPFVGHSDGDLLLYDFGPQVSIRWLSYFTVLTFG